jgi:hypothetical protein
MLTPTKHSHPDRTVLNGVSDAVKRQYWNNPVAMFSLATKWPKCRCCCWPASRRAGWMTIAACAIIRRKPSAVVTYCSYLR